MNKFQSLEIPAAQVSNHWKPFAAAAVLVAAAILGVAGCAQRDAAPATAGGTNGAAVAKQLWHCPMHPTFIRDRMGACDICGMDLVKLEKGSGTNAIPGRNVIHIPPERRQQIGLVTTNVARHALTKIIRATASIEPDETRLAVIAPRIGGFIQELYVNATGRRVEKGEKLFKLYSPELLVAEREYFNAISAGDRAISSAATKRLQLIGLDEEQIDAIRQQGQPADTMDVKSPVAGIVMMKEVKEGTSFMAGEKLYEIADLSHVWLHAFIREPDIADVRTGLTATVTTAAYPNDLFDAMVTFIYPSMDELSRTLEVRLEAGNEDLQLKPDMWATVELEIEHGEKLAVPAEAVINTGRRRVAFVDKGDGHLEPRELKTGAWTDTFVEIRAGLKEGEKVVTRALFLVDSESQLQAAVSSMAK